MYILYKNIKTYGVNEISLEHSNSNKKSLGELKCFFDFLFIVMLSLIISCRFLGEDFYLYNQNDTIAYYQNYMHMSWDDLSYGINADSCYIYYYIVFAIKILFNASEFGFRFILFLIPFLFLNLVYFLQKKLKSNSYMIFIFLCFLDYRFFELLTNIIRQCLSFIFLLSALLCKKQKTRFLFYFFSVFTHLSVIPLILVCIMFDFVQSKSNFLIIIGLSFVIFLFSLVFIHYSINDNKILYYLNADKVGVDIGVPYVYIFMLVFCFIQAYLEKNYFALKVCYLSAACIVIYFGFSFTGVSYRYLSFVSLFCLVVFVWAISKYRGIYYPILFALIVQKIANFYFNISFYIDNFHLSIL